MTCRAKIQCGFAPSARLASTKARVRSDKTCPRTIRAIVSHETAPRPTNSSIIRKPLSSAGEFFTTCDCLMISPSVVSRTMTKIIVGKE